MVAHIYNSSTQEVEVETSGAQSYPQVCNKFKASLGYNSKKQTNNNDKKNTHTQKKQSKQKPKEEGPKSEMLQNPKLLEQDTKHFRH